MVPSLPWWAWFLIALGPSVAALVLAGLRALGFRFPGPYVD